MKKTYEQLAEDLINSIPKEMTLYCKRKKGINLIIQRIKDKK